MLIMTFHFSHACLSILQAGVKRKSITFDDTTEKKTPEGPQNAKKKFVKTPARTMGNKGVYQPPQGKYSSGIGIFQRFFLGSLGVNFPLKT